ncbi:Zinc finger protein ZPR1-like protein [Drosera capensis]
MHCHENGTTRLLLTMIPHFRTVNNEVQFGGELQPRGCCYTLKFPAGDLKMLDWQVVKSESATIKIPELDFKIPPEAQRGSLSTVEGILTRAADGLKALQEECRQVDPQTAEAIDKFISNCACIAFIDVSFCLLYMFILAPSPDPSLTMIFYERSPEQQAALGYLAQSSLLHDTNKAEIANGVCETGKREPHGAIGAKAGYRAIAQANSAEIADALFR